MNRFHYRDKNTSIHQLNPLCKLYWIIIVSLIALFFDHPLYLLFLFGSTLPVVISAGVLREWAGFLKYSLYLCLLIIVFNVLVSRYGTHILWQAPFHLPVLGSPSVTLEALVFGFGMSLRLLTVISAFSLFTLTIHPDDLIQSLLKVKMPYKSILVASLCLRFIPVLIADASQISAIQSSRGLELDRGHIWQKIKNRSAVIIPLLSNSLDRTVQIAEAMESRAFGSGSQRSFYKIIKLSRLDLVILVVSFTAVVLAVIMRLEKLGAYTYYPTLENILLSGWELGGLILLLVLLESIVPLAILKKRLIFD